MMEKRAVVLNPHDDDGIIAIGGILVQLIEKDWKVKYIQMTDGRHGSTSIPPDTIKAIRAIEVQNEVRLLGVDSHVTLDVEDGTLGKLNPQETESLVTRVADEISDYNPAVIFIPAESEGHPDHRATNAIGNAAYERLKQKSPGLAEVRYIVWLFPFRENKPSPLEQVLLIDITKQFNKKSQILHLHASQEVEVKGGYSALSSLFNGYLARAFQNYPAGTADQAEVIAVTQITDGARLMVEGLEGVTDVTHMFMGRKEAGIRS